MRDAFKPVWFIIKNAILLAIAAYPVTMVVQWFSKDKKPFTEYNHYIGYVFGHYWDWILVVIATLLLTRSGDKFFKYVEEMRNRLYELEFYRWKDTPYIAPLHLYYLLAPPVALTSDAKSQALDPFYRSVVSDFRDRVYINAKYTQFDPYSKPSVVMVIGKSLMLQFLVNATAILLIIAGMLYMNPFANITEGWGKAFIPVAAFFLFQNANILRAFTMANPNKSYGIIKKHFDEEEPKITWRDLFPDRPYGESILFAWRADCERRQRLAYEASGRPIPVRMEYTSQGLAPKPFPSEEVPECADAAEKTFFDQSIQDRRRIIEKNREIAGASEGKVVAFPPKHK
ncbi:hypothetical protein EHV15_34060 [Paenibacillus oralis]|uniref:Uncharacterized protein n=1 Tax=Paenibacillus oralis TaxID=2490856 RepID=A0A3P3TAQ7_9BACL|nr:hypothetical protein [Paenibacillus oralis]RRJ54624.1 hypothetical protein EHV15_34060 [Paenibacillus oralis]